MSVCPIMFDDAFDFRRPSRLLDQHFGLGLTPDDLTTPMTLPRAMVKAIMGGQPGYIRPWRTTASQQDVGSTVHCDKDNFQVSLDVQQFKPEEITVKVSGKHEITVEGKHEEKKDDHGYIQRHFVRRYIIPTDCDTDKVESKLSSDGILTITAPKCKIGSEERIIPVTETGKPANFPENKQEDASGDKK